VQYVQTLCKKATTGRDHIKSIKVSVVFFGPRVNVKLEPKFHVPLHASYAALPMATFKTFALM
jgi:hypothetical protein